MYKDVRYKYVESMFINLRNLEFTKTWEIGMSLKVLFLMDKE